MLTGMLICNGIPFWVRPLGKRLKCFQDHYISFKKGGYRVFQTCLTSPLTTQMTDLQLSCWRVCPIEQVEKFHSQPTESKSTYREHLAFCMDKQPVSPFLKTNKQQEKTRKPNVILEQDSSAVGKLEWMRFNLKQWAAIFSVIRTAYGTAIC